MFYRQQIFDEKQSDGSIHNKYIVYNVLSPNMPNLVTFDAVEAQKALEEYNHPSIK